MSKQVVVMVSGDVVNLDDVASCLGVSRISLEKACRDAALETPDGVATFYGEWIAGKLPVQLMPCASRSLYQLYVWWCGQRSVRSESETMLLRALPACLSKSKRHVKVGDHLKTRMVIIPYGWWLDGLTLPVSEQLGNFQAEFERQLERLS